MRKRKGDHVVFSFGDGGGKCNHCGATITFCLPMLLSELVKDCNKFSRKHRSCRPGDEDADRFLSGVFHAMEYLVITRDEPTLAKELANNCSIKQAWGLAEVKRTGYEVRRMNKFIREELTE
jgi:hypothetical protein